MKKKGRKLALKDDVGKNDVGEKTSAVSMPNLTAKAAFFRIFRNLFEKIAENASKPEKSQKSFAPNFGKFWKTAKFSILSYFDILALSKCILYFDILLVFRPLEPAQPTLRHEDLHAGDQIRCNVLRLVEKRK